MAWAATAGRTTPPGWELYDLKKDPHELGEPLRQPRLCASGRRPEKAAGRAPARKSATTAPTTRRSRPWCRNSGTTTRPPDRRRCKYPTSIARSRKRRRHVLQRPEPKRSRERSAFRQLPPCRWWRGEPGQPLRRRFFTVPFNQADRSAGSRRANPPTALFIARR